MSTAQIRIETLTLPTYPQPEPEALPIFAENRVHQRSSGNPYPNRVTMEVDRSGAAGREYTVVHLENDYLDVLILPEIGGRIFAAQDKTTGYDFFYRQHVIKPALIGALGNWISGGVEFNWPYHHRPSGFMPCDYTTQTAPDGSVICWLSEHDPADRMKGMVGIVLRPDASYLETRVQLCNRTPVPRSFLWWENAAVPVNESYQIFFPHDVTYVNFHYLDSRISYPVAGAGSFNGFDMRAPRDISMHKNTRDATSYFACASKYDFFGGYDHGRGCGVVHVANHHISPGKKMFTWAYNQLSRSWERALTDADGQYAELMAGSYTDNQPNFSWIEPYETKTFSQYWYPISEIGTPDFANLSCALRLGGDTLALQATRPFGPAAVTVEAGGKQVLHQKVTLQPGRPVLLDWHKPQGLCTVTLTAAGGGVIARYEEEQPDRLKMPPVKDPMPLAAELGSADELYRAGVHVEQYRDPAVLPDAYWRQALARDPRHVPALLGMARFCYGQLQPDEALGYVNRALAVLTRFNERLESGDPWYLRALILEAMGRRDEAYDDYYRASWNGSAVAKAMGRLACIDLARGEFAAAEEHADRALARDAAHPLAPAALYLALCGQGRQQEADAALAVSLAKDPLQLLGRWLAGPAQPFFESLQSDPAQSALDMAEELAGMGQLKLAARLLEELCRFRPEQQTAPLLFTRAHFAQLLGEEAAGLLAAAETAPDGLAFPRRLLEARALRSAANRGSGRAVFLLGCLLYSKRQYEEAGRLFAEAVKLRPKDPAAVRCLAVACFSHLGRQGEALGLMQQALALRPTPQLLYETVVLMDKLSRPAAEKLELLDRYPQLTGRDDLVTERAKAYNQAGRPQQALQALAAQRFVPCEGGEHAIADQYMFAHYLLGMQAEEAGDLQAAAEAYRGALTLPDALGAGVWNPCRYLPYRYRIGCCLDALGQKEEAAAIFEEILDVEVEFFSRMHLPELPVYQALCARRLGRRQLADRLAGAARRSWLAALDQPDNGYFATTPFFISFVDQPGRLHRAYYLYLLAAVARYEGKEEEAARLFEEAAQKNSENLFCQYAAAHPAVIFG